MLRVLADLALLATRRAARSWLAAVSIPIYVTVFVLAARLLAPLGFVGQVLLGFVSAACFAGYLSLLASAVAGQPLRWVDLKNGTRALWDVVSVFFALMIINLLLAPIERAVGERATALAGVVQLAMAIFLNGLPEILYNGRARSFGALQASASFVLENPVAWFVPNLVLALLFFAATGTFSFSSPGELLVELSGLASVAGVLGLVASAPYWKIPLLIVFVHLAMVFRGLLFQELGSGNARARAYRRRMGG
jgi:hypothetical protein